MWNRFDLHVAKLYLKNPKTTSIYRRRGGASLRAQGPQGESAARVEEDSSSNLVWEGGVLLFLPTSLFPLVFLLVTP